MTIRAVESNYNDGMLSTVVKTTALGAGLGYASKYIIPVTKEERQNPKYEAAMKYLKSESSHLKNDAIEEIRALKHKSPAQDEFLKMVDAKGNKKITPITIRKIVTKLGGPDSFDGIEFNNIVSEVNEHGQYLVKTFRKSYEWTLKKMRPVGPLVAAGGLLGLFTGIAHNVLKTNTNS